MSGPGADHPVIVRRATARELPAVVTLACRTLGWTDDDATRAHFAWKHLDNPFGRSDLWVADVDGALVGLRSFLRWELVAPDGAVWRAARTVDTGTDTAFRRKGIFSRLTTAGLDGLRAEGVDVVFNTPNAQSLPANLTLGWQVVGRVPAYVRPRGARGAMTLVRSRTPADRGALPCGFGDPAPEALADPSGVVARLARTGPAGGLTTHRTPDYLRWRYGHPALHYRVAEGPGAAVVFHLRRRGRATEAVVCDAFADPGGGRPLARLLRRVLEATGADYLLTLAPEGRPRRFLRVPGGGPVLTTRAVGRDAPTAPGAWALTLGDIEGL